MMNGIIRIGNETTLGSQIISGSLAMKFGGIGVAGQGTPVTHSIKKHGDTVIIEGNPEFCDAGILVAFHRHDCTCSGMLLSSMLAVTAG
ncbi:PAAR domain-containing protein [Photorhabdus australis]|uniref:PAAR domain-containing protein n=1 Tax=Photorhabdus australis TaxID=286156 RepID=UPI003B8A9950